MLAVSSCVAALLLSKFVELQAGDWLIPAVGNSAIGNYLLPLAKARGLSIIKLMRRQSAIEQVRSQDGKWYWQMAPTSQRGGNILLPPDR